MSWTSQSPRATGPTRCRPVRRSLTSKERSPVGATRGARSDQGSRSNTGSNGRTPCGDRRCGENSAVMPVPRASPMQVLPRRQSPVAIQRSCVSKLPTSNASPAIDLAGSPNSACQCEPQKFKSKIGAASNVPEPCRKRPVGATRTQARQTPSHCIRPGEVAATR